MDNPYYPDIFGPNGLLAEYTPKGECGELLVVIDGCTYWGCKGREEYVWPGHAAKLCAMACIEWLLKRDRYVSIKNGVEHGINVQDTPDSFGHDMHEAIISAIRALTAPAPSPAASPVPSDLRP